MNAPRDARGLLEQIAEHALDDDYYVVRAGEPHGRPTRGLLVAAVLAAFAVLVTIAAVSARTDRPTSDLERRTLAADVDARRTVLLDRQSAAADLRRQIELLRAGDAPALDPGDLPDLEVRAADVPARGKGLVLTASAGNAALLDGRVTAADLQVLVNGLWYAGAEAIAIDGQRLATTSSVQSVDGVVSVNYQTVRPPYRVVALGDGEALRTRFESNVAGRHWQQRAQAAGLLLSVAPSKDVMVPAAPPERVMLSHARAVEEER